MNFYLQVGVGRFCVNISTTTHKGLNLLFAGILKNLPVPNISTNVPLGTNSMNHTISVFLHLQNLTSMIIVSLSLLIEQVPLFPRLFFIGLTLTIFTSLKIDLI